ncbi:MAG: cyclic nucleotide-binding domain-containing protein [Fibrobacterota bacterium]
MIRFDATQATKLKTGARPGLVRTAPGAPVVPGKPTAPVFHATSPALSKHDRVFHRGSLMFIEGEKGDEMFIIKTGKIKVLKQEGSKSIELATLGPGSVLGELSLLIEHMPRTATAQVVEDVTALAINRGILEETYTKIPPWLVMVIKVVVGRLRDTLRKNSDNLVSNNIGGVVNLLVLLAGDSAPDEDGKLRLSLDTVKDEALYNIGLSGGDTDKIVTELILKDLLVIRKGQKGEDLIEIKRWDILQINFEYLLAHYNAKTLPGEGLSDAAGSLATVMLETGLQQGLKQKDGGVSLARPVLEVALERAGLTRFINHDALDELKNAKVLDADENCNIRFIEKQLRRALLIKEWALAFADSNG